MSSTEGFVRARDEAVSVPYTTASESADDDCDKTPVCTERLVGARDEAIPVPYLTAPESAADDNDKTPVHKRSRKSSSTSPSSSATVRGSPSKKTKRRSNKPPPDWRVDFAAFTVWVERKKVYTKSDAREVIRAFNWRKGVQQQEPEVHDKIEEHLRLKDVPWPTPGWRASLLGGKAHQILEKVMLRFGWQAECRYFDEEFDRPRQYYKPVDRKKPRTKALPEWLPLDYFNFGRDRLWHGKKFIPENRDGKPRAVQAFIRRRMTLCIPTRLAPLSTMGEPMRSSSLPPACHRRRR